MTTMLRSGALAFAMSLSGCGFVVHEGPPVHHEPGRDRDRDRDGLSDRLEADFGTRRDWPDTDLDGAFDGEEVHDLFTDPLDPDTDGDGYLDGEEAYELFTDPLVPDDVPWG